MRDPSFILLVLVGERMESPTLFLKFHWWDLFFFSRSDKASLWRVVVLSLQSRFSLIKVKFLTRIKDNVDKIFICFVNNCQKNLGGCKLWDLQIKLCCICQINTI